MYTSNCFGEDTRLQHYSFELKLKLEVLNNAMFDEVQVHLIVAINDCISVFQMNPY